MRNFVYTFILLAGSFLPVFQPLQASDLFSFVPKNSACALFLDLTEQNLRMPAVQEQLENLIREHDNGLLKKNNLKVKDVCSSFVLSMPSLMESDGYVIAKTALAEKRFKDLLQKSISPEIKYSVAKSNGRNVYQISFLTTKVSGGQTKVKVRNFALAYFAPDIVVITKDSIAPYFKEPRGLTPNMLKLLKVPNAFASGFAITDSAFLLENPFLPPSRLNHFSAVFGRNEDIVLRSEFQTASQEDANQTMLILQQYILLAGLFLNNENPALMQELTKSLKINRNGLNVTVNGSLSKEFFDILGNSAANVQARLAQKKQPRVQQ